MLLIFFPSIFLWCIFPSTRERLLRHSRDTHTMIIMEIFILHLFKIIIRLSQWNISNFLLHKINVITTMMAWFNYKHIRDFYFLLERYTRPFLHAASGAWVKKSFECAYYDRRLLWMFNWRKRRVLYVGCLLSLI